MPRTRSLQLTAVVLAALNGLALAACSTDGQASPAVHPVDRCHQPGAYQLPRGSERVHLDPADFSAHITNRYWPMRPGTTWTYRGVEDGTVQHTRVTVLHRTRDVHGLTARVVHDVVREDGEVVEDTHDWYAQDSGGTVWYVGERSVEYEDGVPVSTEGSWEYGVDGAQAGVIVPARPRPGCRYRQEFLRGEAEDHAAILSTSEDLRLRSGRFDDVLSTGDYAELGIPEVEHKFYARHLGPVLTIGVSPAAREELVAVHRPRS